MLASQDPGHNPPEQHKFVDDEDDEGPLPPPSDPDDRPIPTFWLIRGVSKYGDIPTATQASTMTNGLEGWFEPSPPSAQSSPGILEVLSAEKPRDWYDSRAVMLLGGVLSVSSVMMTAELGRGLFRKFKRDRRPATARLRLLGGEKQLLAYADFSREIGASSFPTQGQP